MTSDNNYVNNNEELISVNKSLLSDECIHLHGNIWNGDYIDKVPPSSPREDLNFQIYEPLQDNLPNLLNFKIPFIREIGIKATIDKLGEYFQCKNYKINLLHFWFLDIITDCLWRIQDEFNLIESDQKIVLEWIIFVFNLTRDRKLNHDRKNVFRIIKEAILLICDVINENNCEIPSPEKLFKLLSRSNMNDDESLVSNDISPLLSYSLQSTISNLTYDKASSYIEFNIEDKRKRYKLGKQYCNCNTSEDVDESSLDSTLKSSTSDVSIQIENVAEESDETETISEEDIKFYVPDTTLPMRFRPIEAYDNYVEKEYPKPLLYTSYDDDNFNIEEQDIFAEDYLAEEIVAEEETALGVYEMTDEAHKEMLRPEASEEFIIEAEKKLSNEIEFIKVPNEVTTTTSQMINDTIDRETGNNQAEPLNQLNDNTEQIDADKQELIERLIELERWEYKMKRMDDSKEGILPTPEESIISIKHDEPIEVIYDENQIDTEWFDIDEEYEEEDENDENKGERVEEQYAKCQDTKFINFTVLHAIIDFIFEYFYENFHFTLIKLAYQFPLSLAVQNCNEKWNVPKIPKGELIKPKDPKPKKEKKKKGKKDKKKKKKDKKSKKSKSKGSSKKSKKSSKSSKKGKKKREKKRKLTKEEKAELERIRREQELLEEERRRIEENRRNLFPLADAATEDLFQSIFQNWIKIDVAKKEKRKGKKKDKKKGKK